MAYIEGLQAPRTGEVLAHFGRKMRNVSRRYAGRPVSYDLAAVIHDAMHESVMELGGLEHLLGYGPHISHGLVQEIHDLLSVEAVVNAVGEAEYINTALRLANDAAEEIKAHLVRCGLRGDAAMIDVGEIVNEGPRVEIPMGTNLATSDGTTFVTTNYTFTLDMAQGASANVIGTVISHDGGGGGEIAWKGMPEKMPHERKPTLSEVWRD